MTPPPTDPTEGAPTGPVSEEVIASAEVQAAIEDLAEREDAAKDQIKVVSHEAITWSDGSIGCPKPGMMYTQALVPGHRLVLEFDGKEFSYHSSDRGTNPGAFNYCADPKLPNNTGGGVQSTM